MSFHVPRWYYEEWQDTFAAAGALAYDGDNELDADVIDEFARDDGLDLTDADQVVDLYEGIDLPTFVDLVNAVEAHAPVEVVPRWWFCTDAATLARITFLPDYQAFQGNMIVTGMRASWGAETMPLCCDPGTGEYFRREVMGKDLIMAGRVFAPAPPPIGLWSGEPPE
jgi:hypothetical protein